jgi:multidrug efflux system membrane fusion protein
LSVSTRLLVDTLKNATVMPDDAVQHGTDGLYVFVVAEGNKADVRKIKIGPSTDGKTLVESGLNPGEQVVTRGQYRVQPGSPLAVNVANSGQPSPVKAD